MSPTQADLIEIYRRPARRYDFTANLYYPLGYRDGRRDGPLWPA